MNNMSDQERNLRAQKLEESDPDRTLDVLLAKYSAVEPRAGLEARVLAHVYAQPSKADGFIRWRWGLAAVVALALLVAASLWRWRTESHPLSAKGNVETNTSSTRPELVRPVLSTKHAAVQGTIRNKKGKSRQKAQTILASAPKREQFPSPQPLSEQEKMLANYVMRFPEHAVLIARAQAEFEKREREEESREMSGTQNPEPKQIEQ